MKRSSILIPALLLAMGGVVEAKTFTKAPLLQEEGVESLNRTVSREWVDRDLFGEPYATVVVGQIDVYDRFPFLESRYFQVVSDPAWNRLLYGEVGRDLGSHDGHLDSFGALSAPRGLSVDASGRLYVADSGNHRVLVYDTWSEFDQMTMVPAYSIDDLSRPYDVAHSDAGTPFDASDDRLYVADTGSNRILAYSIGGSSAVRVAEIGDLGGGRNHFAGPFALTVGRVDGSHTADVYVSDSHNSRIVHLRDAGDRFEWVGEAAHSAGHVTSLDTDHYGAVYAASPTAGEVTKYAADLTPVATLTDVERPRALHVPFVNRTDHRDGTVRRVGQGSALVVEEWTGQSGIQLVKMGVEVKDLRMAAEHDIHADFVLTDRAAVTGEIVEAVSGRVVHRQEFGEMDAGSRSLTFAAAELDETLYDGDYSARIVAHSLYGDNPSGESAGVFTWNGGTIRSLPAEAGLVGNDPNPFRSSTAIHFAIPEGRERAYSLRVYDVGGRLVSTLGEGRATPGIHTLNWDGRDSAGREVAAGVYLYRLQVEDVVSTRKMVFVR